MPSQFSLPQSPQKTGRVGGLSLMPSVKELTYGDTAASGGYWPMRGSLRSCLLGQGK